MNAQVIPFPVKTRRAGAQAFAFEGPPDVEALLERARMVELLYETARGAHNSGAGWLNPPGRLETLRHNVETFWQRCIESVACSKTVFAALERSGADEALKSRVRDHYSAFCHSM